MPKQQTFTVIVGDYMADPVELVQAALERMLLSAPIYPQYSDDMERDFKIRGQRGYAIIEES